MKKNKLLFGFTMAAMAGVCLTACSNNDDSDDAATRSLGGKADLSFAIPHSAPTRLSAAEAQADNSFNGIKGIKFIAMNEGNASDAQATATATYIQTITAINSLAAPLSSLDDVDGTTNGVKIYKNVQFPSVDYTLVRYLFYGESNYATPKGALTMTDISSWNNTKTAGDLRFTLSAIDAPAPALLNDIQTKLVALLGEIDGYVATYSALQAVKNYLTGSNLTTTGTRQFPFSEYGFELLLSYIYGQYAAAGVNVTDAAQATALKAFGTFGFEESSRNYYCNLGATYATLLGGYPKGNYFLTLGYDKDTHLNSATIATRTDELYSGAGNVITANGYCKPASLWYYGNGYLVEQKTVSGISSTYDTQNWTNSGYNNLYQGKTVGNIANPALSGDLAFSHTIQYGVAMAKSSVNLTGATFAPALYSAVTGNYTQQTAVTATSGNFILTGILFSSQRKQADYNFDPVTTDATNSPLVTVYDTDIIGAASNTVNGVGKTLAITGKSLVSAANDNLCYTLLLPSRKISGTLTDDEVKVALELVNNTGVTIIGKNTTPQEPIRPGGTFYIVGSVKYSDILSHQTGVNRIFQSDYITNLNMTIGNMAQANLYTTVPDLTNVVSTIALHIDVTWTTGDTYGMSMGQ